MQNSGESEFSESQQQSKKLTLSFWQSFLLTLSGAAGLIAMVANGPLWIEILGFAAAIAVIVWVGVSLASRRKK